MAWSSTVHTGAYMEHKKRSSGEHCTFTSRRYPCTTDGDGLAEAVVRDRDALLAVVRLSTGSHLDSWPKNYKMLVTHTQGNH
ncbi:hypothetical protein STEG23_000707 [Scotinomys teguina]